MNPRENKMTNEGCGLCGIYPKWLRGWATSRTFIIIYGLLGTVQAMAFIYITVTLSTMEKRFKIPSRTTGIILSGNEISQILSIVLTYYGGSGHRPRWIAIGVALSALSCLVLASPHVIYGAGREALALTKEHLDLGNTVINGSIVDDLPMCSNKNEIEVCDNDSLSDASLLPRLLIFFSQFILGVGTTLYYGLGQTYLDDNTKKKNTPMLLGVTFALRTVGPAIGFLLGFACLSLYIEPSLHPLITKEDPRWLGAWWIGWIFLGATMGMFAVFMAMFPRHLPSPGKKGIKKDGEELLNIPTITNSCNKIKPISVPPIDIEADYIPNVADLRAAMKRILKNRVLTCNNLSAVFYVLAASGFMTFSTKYVEVQYGVSAAKSSIIGPITLIGIVLGFLLSGTIISKFKPGPRKLLGWNVVIGFFFVLGSIVIMFIKCSSPKIQGLNFDTMQLNLTANCNKDCNCEGAKYAPVCHEASGTTFFSACHAGCNTIINSKEYGNCSCLLSPKPGGSFDKSLLEDDTLLTAEEDILLIENQESFNKVVAGQCQTDCANTYIVFGVLVSIFQSLGCSGKIGNVLANYRCVDKRDKSFSQGFSIMIVSLFALIPGPIIYGAIIDSTCLIWEESCGNRGHCWFYHKDNFRYNINIFAAVFAFIGVLFDVAVCYYGKDLDLYGETEDKRREFVKDNNTASVISSNTDKNESKS